MYVYVYVYTHTHTVYILYIHLSHLHILVHNTLCILYLFSFVIFVLSCYEVHREQWRVRFFVCVHILFLYTILKHVKNSDQMCKSSWSPEDKPHRFEWLHDLYFSAPSRQTLHVELHYCSDCKNRSVIRMLFVQTVADMNSAVWRGRYQDFIFPLW